MGQIIKLWGRKIGTTRVFESNGDGVEVTVLQLDPSKVLRHKTLEKDGYQAAVLASGARKRTKLNKPEQGEAKVYGVPTFKRLYELRSSELPEVNSELTAASLQKDLKTDVVARSKGKGFQGVVKRYNFKTQDASHGNSLSHRAPGSIGGNQPGRVWRGKKMAGHMGFEQVTLKRRTIVKILEEESIVLLRGSVPGPNGADVLLTQTIA